MKSSIALIRLYVETSFTDDGIDLRMFTCIFKFGNTLLDSYYNFIMTTKV